MKKLIILCSLSTILVTCSCGKTSNIKETETIAPATLVPTTVATTAQPTETPKSEETIYAANKTINKYINNFNNANPSTPITTEMAQPYYHHGREHEEQIKYYMNSFEVVVSDVSNLEVVIERNRAEKRTSDEYEEMFIKYAKGYNTEIADEILKGYWTQILDNTSSYTKFDDYEVYLRKYDNDIELIQISGKVKR